MKDLLDNTMPNDKACIFQGLSDDVEVAKLTRERDEMRALLDKFERHMAEVGKQF